MRFGGRGVLLDVEGTTTSVDFVYRTLFPYARQALRGFLDARWDESEVAAARERIAADAGHPSFAAWERAAPGKGRELVEAEVLRLMDGDVKATGLKELQGLVWRRGYESGELVSHVYDDVPEALDRWRRAGLDVRIYSSGSVEAQRLLFRHTAHGDLTGRLGGYYDTKVGAKKEVESYRRIAADFRLEPAAILFVSDVVAELDAARSAGLATALSIRPGNAPIGTGHGHPEIRGFGEIEI